MNFRDQRTFYEFSCRPRDTSEVTTIRRYRNSIIIISQTANPSYFCIFKVYSGSSLTVPRESKNRDTLLVLVTSPNFDRFSKFFHFRTQQ